MDVLQCLSEKPVQVLLQEDQNPMRNAIGTMYSQFEIEIAIAASLIPNPTVEKMYQVSSIGNTNF